MPVESPVAFFIFNRPLTTARVWQAIANARPKTLLIVGDAAREGKAGEAEKVAAARKIVEQVDWPCRVVKNYAGTNMGCKRRISSGLKWVFDEVSEAIILEDDCLPDPSFFSYCDELLDRYRNDERVFSVSGARLNPPRPNARASYYFSKYFACWGWASWRRSHAKYDVQMSDWPEFRDQGQLAKFADLPDEAWFWPKKLNRVYEGGIDTWDFQWQYAAWRQGAMHVIPAVNLVANIGFSSDGTHTKDPSNPLADLPVHSMLAVEHPQWMLRDKQEDIATYQTCLGLKGVRRLKWLAKAYLSSWRHRAA